MKSMKLYSDVHRIYKELAALGIGPDQPLRVDQLTPFDQYHYDGTAAVDAALAVFSLADGAKVLDIGSGIGGPARYIAAQAAAQVTAVELQADLNAVGQDLTARCGLSGRVAHVCGNILEAELAGGFDAIISMLCMLHIPDKAALFAACRALLKPRGVMYIEDFARARAVSAAEADDLAVKVQCRDLPTAPDYAAQLRAAGFGDVALMDVTADWTRVASDRAAAAKASHARNVAIHGADTVAGLEDFYDAVAGLWQGGALTGLKIVAR